MDLVADDSKKVAPINCFGKALIEQVHVFLKGVQVSRVSSPHYGLKTYIETVCSYGKDATDGHLNVSSFLKDEPGKQDTNANASFEKRHKFIALSRNVHINEPIHT